MLLHDIRADGNAFFRNDAAIGPDLEDQALVVGHLSDAGVLHRVVHLTHGRIDAVDGDDRDRRVLVLVLICRHIASARGDVELHGQRRTIFQSCDVQIRIEDLQASVGDDVCRNDFLGTGRVDDGAHLVLAVKRQSKLLEVQDDLRNVFLDAGDRGEFVQNSVNSYGSDGCTGQGAEKDPS